MIVKPHPISPHQFRLSRYVRLNSLAEIKYIIDVNYENLLKEAAYNKFLDIVKYLVQKRADIYTDNDQILKTSMFKRLCAI
jgi:hypothetical protein